ncbi:hypothetical protein GMSM_08390 [Geomonas sp. Red276]
MPRARNPITVFETGFLNAPHLQLAAHIMGIGDAFMAHHLYKEMPPGVPDGAQIKDIGFRYHELAYAVITGDTGKKSQRDALRDQAVQATCLALNWAGMRYLVERNFELICNLGVDHKKAPAPRSSIPAPLTAPINLSIKHGKINGTLLLKFGKVKGAAAYFVQVCNGDPNDESAWCMEWKFTKIRGGVDLTGLEPGKVYFVRVRCLGHAGLGPWSVYVHLMAV